MRIFGYYLTNALVIMYVMRHLWKVYCPLVLFASQFAPEVKAMANKVVMIMGYIMVVSGQTLASMKFVIDEICYR